MCTPTRTANPSMRIATSNVSVDRGLPQDRKIGRRDGLPSRHKVIGFTSCRESVVGVVFGGAPRVAKMTRIPEQHAKHYRET
jgi:hypothetical protein